MKETCLADGYSFNTTLAKLTLLVRGRCGWSMFTARVNSFPARERGECWTDADKVVWLGCIGQCREPVPVRKLL